MNQTQFSFRIFIDFYGSIERFSGLDIANHLHPVCHRHFHLAMAPFINLWWNIGRLKINFASFGVAERI
jgi:hypothetical protein